MVHVCGPELSLRCSYVYSILALKIKPYQINYLILILADPYEI